MDFRDALQRYFDAQAGQLVFTEFANPYVSVVRVDDVQPITSGIVLVRATGFAVRTFRRYPKGRPNTRAAFNVSRHHSNYTDTQQADNQ